MWWQYLLVFVLAFLLDVVALPLPPAFTAMLFLQMKYDLALWPVIIVGVTGSVIGRYVLMLYVPKISNKLFKPAKNEDIQYLGQNLKDKGWGSQLFIFAYCLLPLPSTPLFIASGIAKMKPYYIIPAFFVGKFISDAMYVLLGKYATENTMTLLQGVVSWRSIGGLFVGFLLIFILLFIDWRTLLRHKQVKLDFKIWR